jgi:hypothetical protein
MLQPMKLIATSQIPINLTARTSTDCSEIYVGSFDRMAFGMRENVSVQAETGPFASTGQIGFFCHSAGRHHRAIPCSVRHRHGSAPVSAALAAVLTRVRSQEWPSAVEFAALLAEAGTAPAEAEKLTGRYAAAIGETAHSAEAKLLESLRGFTLPPQ